MQLLQPAKFLKTGKKVEKANFSTYIFETYLKEENEKTNKIKTSKKATMTLFSISI